MTPNEYRIKGNVLFTIFILVAITLSIVNFINAFKPSFTIIPLIPAVIVLPAILAVIYYWINNDRFMQPIAKLIFRMLNWDVYWNVLMAIFYLPHFWFFFVGLAIFYYFINLKAVGCKFLYLLYR